MKRSFDCEELTTPLRGYVSRRRSRFISEIALKSLQHQYRAIRRCPVINFQILALILMGSIITSCVAPMRSLKSLDAVEAMSQAPNLLDYPAVYNSLKVPFDANFSEYVLRNAIREPSVVTVSRKFPFQRTGLMVTTRLLFSGHPDRSFDRYDPDVAVADIDVSLETECVRLEDLIARFGEPASATLALASPGHVIPHESDYTWKLAQTSRHRVTLVVAQVRASPEQDDLNRNPNPPRLPLALGSDVCVRYGLSVEEVRPGFHFTDIRPRLPIPPEPPPPPPQPTMIE